jgi:hypothetical protein
MSYVGETHNRNKGKKLQLFLYTLIVFCVVFHRIPLNSFKYERPGLFYENLVIQYLSTTQYD